MSIVPKGTHTTNTTDTTSTMTIIDQRSSKDEILSHGAEAVASLASKTKQIEDLKQTRKLLLWSLFWVTGFAFIF